MLAAAVVMMAFSAFAQEKPKIAVYVTGAAEQGTNKALMTMMLNALVNTGMYQAVERSEEFLRQVTAEQLKQRSGAVDDDQIKRLGKQFGVDFVCISDITPALGGNLISARIVNVESAEVVAMANTNSPLKTLEDLTNAVSSLFGGGGGSSQGSGSGNAKIDGEAAFKRGNAADDRKDYDTAIKEFTEAIRLDPGEARYYFYRAMKYRYNKKDYDKAIADYSEAIRLNPMSDMYLRGRGDSYKEKVDYDKAISDYTEAIKVGPYEYQNYEARGKVYMTKRDFDKAIVDFTEAIKLKPNQFRYGDRGDAYLEKGDYDRAIADYTEAIKIKPEYYYYSDRGEAYMKKGMYANAVADFEAVLRLKPDHYSAKKNLEDAREKAGAGSGGAGSSGAVQQSTGAAGESKGYAETGGTAGGGYTGGSAVHQTSTVLVVPQGPGVRRHDWYYSVGHVLPLGGMPSWGGMIIPAFGLEGGVIWGDGKFFGLDFNLGFSENEAILGGGLNFGRTYGEIYDLRDEGLRFVYGGGAGLWVVGGERGENLNFLAPFVKLRWKYLELSYRGLFGIHEGGSKTGFGWNNHQFMLSYYVETSKRVQGDYARNVGYTQAIAVSGSGAAVSTAQPVQQPVQQTAPAQPVQPVPPIVYVPPQQTAPAQTVQQPVQQTVPAQTVQQPVQQTVPAQTVQQPVRQTAPAQTVQQPVRQVAVQQSKPEPIQKQPRKKAAPNGKLGDPSFGAGVSFATDGGAGIYGMIDYIDDEMFLFTVPWYGYGAHVFLDVKYVELGASYILGTGKRQYTYLGETEKDDDFDEYFTVAGVSALLKYPIGLGSSVSVFPAAGIEYALMLSCKTVAGDEEWEWDGGVTDDGGTRDNARDFSALWFKAGGGLDIALGGSLFLRAEALYGFRLPSKYENANADESGESPALGHGLTVRAGVGINF